jgi:glycerophosphoryl diester phosphodiesterase
MARVTKIAAHRGGAQLWPENSRMAFRNAMQLDVDFIEFDVHRTRDGILVVHHDAVLGRTSEGSGAIAEQDWSVLKSLKLHGTDGERLPTLSEILDILADGRPALRLEIKYKEDRSRYSGLESEILAELRNRGLLVRTTVTAFDLEVLREVQALAPGQPTIHLIREQEYQAEGRQIAPYAQRAQGAGIREIAVRIEHVQEKDRELCAAFGIELGVFAAHDIPAIKHAFDLGISAFTTDRPDLALTVEQERSESKMLHHSSLNE